MSELFEVEESLSPKLAWLKKHKFNVELNGRLVKAREPEPWECWKGDSKSDAIDKQLSKVDGLIGPYYAAGATEDEAIFWMAQAHGLPLWNEEEFAKTKT